MNREAFGESFFNLGRLAYVVVIAALVILVDVTVLDLVGIETTAQAISQFVVVLIGAYVGLSIVDYATADPDEKEE